MASDNLAMAQVNITLAIKSLDKAIEETPRSVLTDTYIADLRTIKGNMQACRVSLSKMVAAGATGASK